MEFMVGGALTAIIGASLIDGRSDKPLHDSIVLLEDQRILAVGTTRTLAIPFNARVIHAYGKTLMPGLIDVGVRMSRLGHLSHDIWDRNHQHEMRERIMPLASETLLNHGVTTARFSGGNLDDIFWLRNATQRHQFPSPEIHIAAAPLCKCEPQRPYYSYIPIFDTNDLERKIRGLAASGVHVIKVLGDQFSYEELWWVVEFAHDFGLPVDITVHRLDTLRAALHCDVGPEDVLYHVMMGSDLTEFPADVVDLIVEKQVGIVPTFNALDGFRQFSQTNSLINNGTWRDSLPLDLWRDIHNSYKELSKHPFVERATQTAEPRRQRLRQLIKAGASIVLGTDSGNRCNPHPQAVRRELEQFVTCGMSPTQAIQAATAKAGRALYHHDIGIIGPNKAADLLLLEGNPLENLKALDHPLLVIKAGRVVVNHLASPTFKHIVKHPLVNSAPVLCDYLSDGFLDTRVYLSPAC